MALPTAVNGQISDSVAQANTTVLGNTPAVALSNVYQATGQALANAAHAATFQLAQTWSVAQAATTQSVSTLLAVDTAATGKATQFIEKPRY